MYTARPGLHIFVVGDFKIREEEASVPRILFVVKEQLHYFDFVSNK